MTRRRPQARNERRRREAGAERGAERPPRIAEPPAPAPPPWRDPWAWLAALAVLPLLLRSWGAPLGEPVAEDFDFLHVALFDRSWHLLDGGGSAAYWRPLSLQVYYRAFGHLMLAHPGAIATIHALALAAGAFLLCRALRAAWPAPLACAAGAFPLLAESTRQLIAWPDHSSDLGLFLFSALALHEASRRRLPGALAALLAALLCKELAVVTAVLLPFLPVPPARPPGERRRWLVAVGALLVAWGGVSLWVRAHAHLVSPQALVHGAEADATPLAVKLAWAVWGSLRAAFSLGPASDRRDVMALAALVPIGLVALIALLRGREARRRLRWALPWCAWGGAWFVLSSAALVPLFPVWLPNRSQFGSLGLGVALLPLVGAAQPLLPAALLAARLAVLAIAPAPPREIVGRAPETGSFVDFERLTRLQLLMREMRGALASAFPHMPPGSRVGLQYLPRQAAYAFGGDQALQVWYGDSTLHWVKSSEFMTHRDTPLLTIAQFQAEARPQIGLVSPAAMRASLDASDWITAGRFAEGLAAVDRARTLQPRGRSTLFDGTVAGQRAIALIGLGRDEEAEREAEFARRAWPQSMPAHFALARLALRRGDPERAEALVDSALRIDPREPHLLELRQEIERARSAHPATP